MVLVTPSQFSFTSQLYFSLVDSNSLSKSFYIVNISCILLRIFFQITPLLTGSINMPLSDVQDFIIISKKCQMHHLSANAERAMRNFHYYGNCSIFH